MKPVNAKQYIPQQPPFVLVDSFFECNDAEITTSFIIPEQHIFVQNGQLSAAGIMENIAQTCATRIGWLNHNEPVKIGVIGSINRFEINFLPFAGQTLLTRVEVLSEIFGATIVKAEIQCEGETVAQGEMKVFVTKQNILRESEE